MTVNLLRTTYHPVVKTYMDVIQKGINKGNIQCVDVLPGDNTISKKDFLLTDSPLVAIKYMFKGFKNHIVWFQGVSPEESYMANKSQLRCIVLSWIEKTVLRHAKLVFLVSESMKAHYENKYKIDLSKKSFIMPCYNETAVVEGSFENVKYKENNFLYVGSLLPWQCFKETVELYAQIERKSHNVTKFYVFTQQKEEANRILNEQGVKNYEVVFVAQAELSDRIKRMKYGFVLRENSVVNNVATPTKFSNYLANGIIPIYSSVVESFADFDKENKLGIVCNLDDLDSGVERILAHMQRNLSAEDVRKKCEYAFSDYYNADMYIVKIAETLKELV